VSLKIDCSSNFKDKGLVFTCIGGVEARAHEGIETFNFNRASAIIDRNDVVQDCQRSEDDPEVWECVENQANSAQDRAEDRKELGADQSTNRI